VDNIRLKFGNREKSVAIFITGLIPILLAVWIASMVVFREGETIPIWFFALLLMGVMILFVSFIWILSKIGGNRLVPLIDPTEPDEIVVFRVTKDGIIIPLIAPKGTYGKAETICYGNDADFMDTSDFPYRTINGNPAMIVFDMLNTGLDLKRSVARKYMKKHVVNGVDGYKIAKEKGKVKAIEWKK